ncbi:MAG: hypothetical protein V3S63_04890 [bacterium]
MTSSEFDKFVHSVREVLSDYGRDYAIGAIRGLAVRNMLSVKLPATTPEFYPIVKVHSHALEDLEELFYSYLESAEIENSENIINKLVEERVWEEI